MAKDNNIYIIRYGFYYEHDNILGAFSSYYFAGKAKKEFNRKNDNAYDYVKIEVYIIDETLS